MLTPSLLYGLFADSWLGLLCPGGSPGKNLTGRLSDVRRFLTQFTASALTVHERHASIWNEPKQSALAKTEKPYFLPWSSSWFLMPPSASVKETQTQLLLAQHTLWRADKHKKMSEDYKEIRTECQRSIVPRLQRLSLFSDDKKLFAFFYIFA